MNNKDYYLNKLDNILQSEGIPSNYYSFFGYAEEAVCLEELTHSFLVYTGERWNRYEPREHLDIISACHDIISRLSDSNSKEKELMNKLLKD